MRHLKREKEKKQENIEKGTDERGSIRLYPRSQLGLSGGHRERGGGRHDHCAQSSQVLLTLLRIARYVRGHLDGWIGGGGRRVTRFLLLLSIGSSRASECTLSEAQFGLHFRCNLIVQIEAIVVMFLVTRPLLVDYQRCFVQRLHGRKWWQRWWHGQ